MPLNKDIKKVLVIGSGPIVIGQAAEFDYAGAQACRVLKDAGLDVVLVNSNPATIMTDSALADEIYLEPLTAKTIKRIIEKEKPDSMLAGLGGQVGLTIAMELSKEGFLEAHGVRLLGTNAEAIDKAEDRQLFKDTMAAIGQPTIASDIAETLEDALAVADRIGYPVIVRPAFTLGGAGGGVAYSEEELKIIARTGLDMSPITQILVERYIKGWKEIEFETMRDGSGNVIAVCSMENFDPVGVHTGDSIVVAPALTLADKEYQMLRKASLDIISALGIVGGCNCQFALNPDSFEYAVIEVNPRVSRSSALASKATGYPIAKITTKVALGYDLDEITNDITGKTCACFEPAVDYVVVKLPKWPFDKFYGSSRELGTQMKATGEVMSIAPSFEMGIMQAVRGAEIGLNTLNAKPLTTSRWRCAFPIRMTAASSPFLKLSRPAGRWTPFMRSPRSTASFSPALKTWPSLSCPSPIASWTSRPICRPSAWAIPTPPWSRSPTIPCRPRRWPTTRWWTPAPPSSMPPPPTSTLPLTSSAKPGASAAPVARW